MTYIITNDCINCKACEIVCPVEAIIEPATNTNDCSDRKNYISAEHYYIDRNKCDCCNLFNIARCLDICPMDAIRKIESN